MTGKAGIIKIPENLKNPITNPLVILFTRLNELNGFLFLLHSHLDGSKRSITYALEKGKRDFSSLFAGSALVIIDLSELSADKWPRYYSVSRFSAEGEEYLRIIDDLVNRESAWTISQAYEAFETFLKEILATFFTENSNEKKYRNEFHNSLKLIKHKPRKTLDPDSVKDRRILISKYYQNTELFTLIRNIAPEFSRLEKQNSRGLDLTVWYRVITEARHGITHSNCLIKKQKIEDWTQYEHHILAEQLKATLDNQGYMLNPTMEDARIILTLFAEYGFLVFKCLSEIANYDFSNILTHPPPKGD